MPSFTMTSNSLIDELPARLAHPIGCAGRLVQSTVPVNFFNHFPTKQHLIREIASTFLHELLAVLDETRRNASTTGERLGRFFTRIADDIDAASPMRRALGRLANAALRQ